MSKQQTPSQKLALVVVNRLIEAGLLRSGKSEQLAVKVAAGEMKGPDWKLEIELAKKVGRP